MSLSKTLRFRVFQRDEFACQYCGRKAPDVVLEPDHIIPKSAGGADTYDNLVAACFDCNRGKSDRPLVVGKPQRTTQVRYGYTLCWLTSAFAPNYFPVDTRDIKTLSEIPPFRLYDLVARTKVLRDTPMGLLCIPDPVAHIKGLLAMVDGESEESVA